jgi:hypothetical protein
VSVRTSAFEYHQESAGFDCSVDEGFVLHLPDEAIAKAMDLTWAGDAADFRALTVSWWRKTPAWLKVPSGAPTAE